MVLQRALPRILLLCKVVQKRTTFSAGCAQRATLSRSITS